MTAFEFSATPARRKLSGSVASVMLMALVIATLAHLNAETFYYGDLLTFFLPALFGASLFTAFVAFIAGHRILAAVAVILVLLNGFPLIRPVDKAATSANGPELRVATSNVLGNRSNYGDLLAWSTNSGIDILGQQEVSGYALRRFEALRAHFPSTPPADLLGRHPEVMAWTGWHILKAEHVKNVPILPVFGWGGAPLRLELTPPGAHDTKRPALVVYVLHPTTPRSYDQWVNRNAYLEVVAKAIAAEPPGTPIVAMGDFNTPTWSPFFQSFLKTSGLADASGTNWPSTTRFSRRFAKLVHFGSPVDHILVSRDIEVKRFEVGPDIGSDHFPVLADLRLP
ncbi:endonuclease/exonuclease/phosphatase family protein [Pleomorphomonas sp. JP5]|uniref:endonuclease/exonuclease/phosphatase family protein n=1 Tax=Pleomorphomonas sp. JP5 TaxID=2942998 RepID=UPI002044B6C8|nr:endonuclease/exonuclease/phosphatase family protein [Pleomorphomonas sp. JP5]MCM5560341.1 endonuclease/exonuclease/phosphatase family protein [Pleomorphomonas sp. JP5]